MAGVALLLLGAWLTLISVSGAQAGSITSSPAALAGAGLVHEQVGTTDTLSAASVAADEIATLGISTGGDHTCALLTSDSIKCWGLNSYGQLGDGSSNPTLGTISRTTPVDVVNITDVLSISTGWMHSCALLNSGKVKCWGWNGEGQLGTSAVTVTTSPVEVTDSAAISQVRRLSAGEKFTCVRTEAGAVYCWGRNANGQLGIGTVTLKSVEPVSVTGLVSGVTEISAGWQHACARLNTGGVRCWGDNTNGQLGDNSTTQQAAPVDVSGLTTGVMTIAAGGTHTCALMETGGVKCWGDNAYGQLGDGASGPGSSRLTPVDVTGLTSNVTALSLGVTHSCALLLGGGVRCWGGSDTGQVGNGGTGNGFIQVTPSDVTGLTSGVASISASPHNQTGAEAHTCARLTAGGIKCWGSNSYGKLGTGDFANRATPVDVIWQAGGGSGSGDGFSFTASTTAYTFTHASTGTFVFTLANTGTTDLADVSVAHVLPDGMVLSSFVATGTNVTRTAENNPTAGDSSLEYSAWTLGIDGILYITQTVNVDSLTVTGPSNSIITATVGSTVYTASVDFLVAREAADPASAPVLSNIELGEGAVLSPSFVSQTVDYTVTVANAVTSLPVTATRTAGPNLNVSYRVIGAQTPEGFCASGPPVTCDLDVGLNTILITILNDVSNQSRTYTLNVTRQAYPILDGLSFGGIPIFPVFSSSVYTYQSNISGIILDEIPVSITQTTDAGATVLATVTLPSGEDVACSSSTTATFACPLDPGKNIIAIVLTDAVKGTATYILELTMGAAPTGPILDGLSLSNGITLTPAFAPGVLNYDAVSPDAIGSISIFYTQTTDIAANVAATVTDPNILTMPCQSSAPGQLDCGLQPGSNAIEIVVTDAVKGVTSYNIGIDVGNGTPPPSGGPILDGLSLGAGAVLTPAFASNVYDYDASVADIPTITVQITQTTDISASVAVSVTLPDASTLNCDDADGDKIYVCALAAGLNLINVELIDAVKGAVSYNITIESGSTPPPPPPPGGPILDGLSLSNGITLTPAFSSRVLNYDAAITDIITSVSVFYTQTTDIAANVAATVTTPDGLETACTSPASGQLDCGVQEGLNAIEIVVTDAVKGIATYTIGLIVGDAPPPPPAPLLIDMLLLGQRIQTVPTFRPDVYTYTAVVPNQIAELPISIFRMPDAGITLVITATQPDGTQLPCDVNGEGTLYICPLAEGDNVLRLTLSRAGQGAAAANRNASQDDVVYTLTVSRAGPLVLYAMDDAAATQAGMPAFIDVLFNDSVPLFSTVSVVAVGTPATGTATLDDNRIIYTPPQGFSGMVDFTYTITNTPASTETANRTEANVSVVVMPAIGNGEDPVVVVVVDPTITNTIEFTEAGLDLVVPPGSITYTLAPTDIFIIAAQVPLTPTGNVEEPPMDNGGPVNDPFQLNAFATLDPLDSIGFDPPIFITSTIPPEGMTDVNPATVDLFYWNENTEEWASDGVECDTYDPETGLLTCAVSHFTEFGAFGGSGFLFYFPWAPREGSAPAYLY